jgi:hypothetical protein
MSKPIRHFVIAGKYGMTPKQIASEAASEGCKTEVREKITIVEFIDAEQLFSFFFRLPLKYK